MMRRAYRFDGRVLFALDEDGSGYPLDGDPARALVRDLLGEIEALDVFADEIRSLFFHEPPIYIDGDSALRVWLAGVSP